MCGIGGHHPQVVRLLSRYESPVTRSSARRRRACVVCTELFALAVATTHRVYQITLKNLWNEAELGACKNCAVLWRGVLKLLMDRSERPRRDSFGVGGVDDDVLEGEGAYERDIWRDLNFGGLCVEYQRDPNFECSALVGGWRIYCRCEVKPCVHAMYYMTFDVFTLAGSGKASAPQISIPLKPLRLVESGFTGSQRTIDFLRKCLTACEARHDCSKATGQEISMPIRLLRLNDDSVQLVEVSRTTEIRYACLAHRWATRNSWEDESNSDTAYAQSRRCRTLQKNLGQHMEGIGIGKLLPTYQDAVFVAKALGLEYLWIDSLCIIQDDAADKVSQIANMGAIYSNAYFTIAADTGQDHTHHFLQNRTWRWRAHRESPNENTVNSDNSAIYFRERPSHANLSWTGLFNRGWCFQERLLSQRVLRFQETEVAFECNTTLECECGSAPSGHQGPWQSLSRAHHVHDKAAFPQTVLNKRAAGDAETWHFLVHVYSLTRLTVEADRMNALAGIAGRVGGLAARKTRYLAGLWETSLVQDLLWYTELVSGYTRGNSTPSSTVPSWSWMSLSLGRHRVLYSQKQDFEALVQADHVLCEPRSAYSPFGDVLDGAYVELEGQVLPFGMDFRWKEGLAGFFAGGKAAVSCLSWDPGRKPSSSTDYGKLAVLKIARWRSMDSRREGYLFLQCREEGGFDTDSGVIEAVRVGYVEVAIEARDGGLNSDFGSSCFRKLRIF